MREYSKFIYLFIILIIVSSCDFEGEKNPKPPISIFPLSAKFSIGTKIFRLPLVSIISTEKKSNALIVCRDSKWGDINKRQTLDTAPKALCPLHRQSLSLIDNPKRFAVYFSLGT